jgi:hypothetical protein
MPNAAESSNTAGPGRLALPSSIKTASWIWIVSGCMVLLFAAGQLPLIFLGSLNKYWLLSFLLMGMTGVVLLREGVRTLRGRARDTVFSACVSMIFGLGIMLGEYLAGWPDPDFVVYFSVPPLIAGVLAFASRGKYLAWREARNLNQEGKKPT